MSKGNKVKLATFMSWGFSGVFGFASIYDNGTKFVTSVWCKICAKHKDEVFLHPAVKGASRISVETFIKGTNVVTKFTVSVNYFLSFMSQDVL